MEGKSFCGSYDWSNPRIPNAGRVSWWSSGSSALLLKITQEILPVRRRSAETA